MGWLGVVDCVKRDGGVKKTLGEEEERRRLEVNGW